MVVHLFLNNNKDLDFLPINSIKNGGVTGVHLNLSGHYRGINELEKVGFSGRLRLISLRFSECAAITKER